MPLSLLVPSPIIGIWEIVESWQDMLELFNNKALYADEVLKIKSDHRKCEWLAVRLLIKYLTEAETPVCYKENGSPFLSDNQYHISISHTKGYAAIILSQYPHPGIDIEYRSDRAWKLRSKFLNVDELALIDLIHSRFRLENEPFRQQTILLSTNQTAPNPSPLQTALATLCWCSKETAFKALQESEIDFINHLHIEPFIISEKGILLLKETKTKKQTTFQIHYQLSNDYIITWFEANRKG